MKGDFFKTLVIYLYAVLIAYGLEARCALAGQVGHVGIARPSDVIEEVNLSGTWEFKPEGRAWTKIKVPGGGWLKQGFDCEAGTYQTYITIPRNAKSGTVRLELGAINHLAEYYIGPDTASLKPVGSEVTAFTGQVVDLTPHVEPGGKYLLRVFVRAYKDGRPIAPHWAEWCESLARGIFRDAWLRVYPEVFISDTHIKTSVAKRELTCDVWIENHSNKNRVIKLSGFLELWNKSSWSYPSLPNIEISIPAGKTVKVTLGPVAWSL